jgi:hypothetical protein
MGVVAANTILFCFFLILLCPVAFGIFTTEIRKYLSGPGFARIFIELTPGAAGAEGFKRYVFREVIA